MSTAIKNEQFCLSFFLQSWSSTFPGAAGRDIPVVLEHNVGTWSLSISTPRLAPEIDVLQDYPFAWICLAAVELHSYLSSTSPSDVLVCHVADLHRWFLQLDKMTGDQTSYYTSTAHKRMVLVPAWDTVALYHSSTGLWWSGWSRCSSQCLEIWCSWRTPILPERSNKRPWSSRGLNVSPLHRASSGGHSWPCRSRSGFNKSCQLP